LCTFPGELEPLHLSDYKALCLRHPFLRVDFPGIMLLRPHSKGGGIVRRTSIYEQASSTFALAKFRHMRPDRRCDASTGYKYDRETGGCLMRFERHAEGGFGRSVVASGFNSKLSTLLHREGTLSGEDLTHELAGHDGGYVRAAHHDEDRITCSVLYWKDCKHMLDPLHFNAFSFSHDSKYLLVNSYYNSDLWFFDQQTLRPLFGMKSNSELWEEGSYNLLGTAFTHQFGFNDDGAAFYNHGSTFVRIKPGGGIYTHQAGKYHILAYNNGLNRYSWQTAGEDNSEEGQDKYDDRSYNPYFFERYGRMIAGQSSRCVEFEVTLPVVHEGRLVRKGSATLLWSATLEDIYPSSDLRFQDLRDPLTNRTAGMVTQIEGRCVRFDDGSTAVNWGVNAPQVAHITQPWIDSQPFFTIIQTTWLGANQYKNVPMLDVRQHGSVKESFASLTIIPSHESQ